ncbi:efflux RND transporter periplasmic adaptor subunit [Chitinophaga pendula]|uniref:efflux RND transporter periplasmic adaptor subunit n=1 Tax=Chitinophaga TaxID=79328 RepID=UPI000BAF78D3|nr:MULTISPECIES: efflux RND transporter periplasmic adaptor subunit [Chitinophaga]ASZ12750.1 copper transporter [Chitinophaga sp. MD30]UCJ09630.1 efflux RND transporter periplasmic adaptor subunit [Chitinophaga pendula]
MQIKYHQRLYALLLIVAGWAACRQSSKPAGEKHTAHQQHIATAGISLDAQLQPTNKAVLAQLPVTVIKQQEVPEILTIQGFIGYDTRKIGTIAARVAGRIEKLYIKRRYQDIQKGDPVMEIYSPALLNAQQQLLLLLQQEASNTPLLEAAKQKLLLLGVAPRQLQQVIAARKPVYTFTVYSPYSGHIHEAAGAGATMGATAAAPMTSTIPQTAELPVKEGMYIEQGQAIFEVNNPAQAWAELYLFPEQETLVKLGDRVRITPTSGKQEGFRAQISYIAPFYKADSRQLTARVYFDNNKLHLPIGSEVSATVFSDGRQGYFLPQSAVISLGMEKAVFVKHDASFHARKITAGISNGNLIQIKEGLTTTDTVAVNAQYLVDSESFVNVNE